MTTEREPKEKFDEQREESPYKCSLCDRAFSDRSEFEQHQNSMHREQQSI
ncbi:MAG: C2H2-type zinc finger protein [Thermoproteota archaeon]|nr:C2H2-type zinc finger protein [Thermoproteota archaeon]